MKEPVNQRMIELFKHALPAICVILEGKEHIANVTGRLRNQAEVCIGPYSMNCWHCTWEEVTRAYIYDHPLHLV